MTDSNTRTTPYTLYPPMERRMSTNRGHGLIASAVLCGLTALIVGAAIGLMWMLTHFQLHGWPQ